MEQNKMLGFELRTIHNLTREVVRKSGPAINKPPLSQLQAGIMGYLFHHQQQPVYQKHIEEEFNISGATATNSLQVMERNGLITRSCVDKDGRLKRISMTREAMQEHMLVEEHMRMMEQKMLEGLGDAEREELFRLLGLVRGNLERINREADKEESEKC